jgi:hypothetical protein
MSYVSGRFVKAKPNNSYEPKKFVVPEKAISGEDALLEYFKCKKIEKMLDGCECIKNKVRNGKLYIFFKNELRAEAKKYGIKFDWNIRVWYIPEGIRKEDLEKLLTLSITLYGHQSSVGYMNYVYKIEVPKFLCIDDDTGVIKNGRGSYKKEKVIELFFKE